MGEGGDQPVFWVLGGQTRVDTEALLAANEPLRSASSVVKQCAGALARAMAAAHSAGSSAADLPIEEVLWSLERSLKTIHLVQEGLRTLLFWRERAAQIYASAEQSVSGLFSGCADASVATCGQPGTVRSYQYRWVPLLSRVFRGVGLGEASGEYLAAMRGSSAGSGAEALHAQMQIEGAAAGLLPFLSRRFHGTLLGRPVAPGTAARSAAGVLAGMLGRRRALVGRGDGTTLLTTVPLHGSRTRTEPRTGAGAVPVEFGRASADGAFRHLTPGGAGHGVPTRLGSAATWLLTSRSHSQAVSDGKRPAPRLPQSARPPLRGDDVLRRMETSAPHGEIEILRHETGGQRSWSVLVRGTKSWSPLTTNPHDLLSNLQEVGGAGSDQRQTVAAAMTMAGIGPGDPVELVGHSQGGAVVANLAADPDFAGRFNVKTVLTAGAPAGGIGAPIGDAQVLSLENLSDVVPALDGSPNAAHPGGITVYFDSAGDPAGRRTIGGNFAGAHAVQTYTGAASALEDGAGQGDATGFFDYRRSALGLGPATTSTVQYFQTERVPGR